MTGPGLRAQEDFRATEAKAARRMKTTTNKDTLETTETAIASSEHLVAADS
eukprot:CAMPEP_0181046224 /NCGR_PEP_ID=MMETSP1070-20121207/14231_1 /TAXON_ID=265543 /ORGANISM="Minutocellus polymorphus, Strain NH13" /LENGTH=50 /DNA_ID=CAMNT_0023124813 /DNA_START=377 /DNA_END=527 /DNA_ORIENTATION=-